ncbi:MAG: ATP-dependent Clp protease ATP-binding subunit [Parcubacteria group bacterium]|nr:ATP-dependent Clp protease ATP-binding subunit [Parcubacteria group bacterium]
MKTYFEEPRFSAPPITRWCMRVIPFLSYLVLSGIALLFLFESSSSHLRYAGFLLALFLLDALFYRNEAMERIDEFELSKREKVNIALYTSPKVLYVVEKNMEHALFLKKDFYLLLCLDMVRERYIVEALRRLELEEDSVVIHLQTLLEDEATDTREDVSGKLDQLMNGAFTEARRYHKPYIDESDLFVSLLLQGPPSLTNFFIALGVHPSDVSLALLVRRRKKGFLRIAGIRTILLGTARRYIVPQRRVMNRAWTARPTPLLDSFSTDITYLAGKELMGFLIGHKEEYARMVQILKRPMRNNVLLVGEPGVGKEALVQYLAYQIAKDNTAKELFDKRIVEVSVHGLLAGTEASGGVQKRVMTILNEIRSAGNVVLSIPDIHHIVKTSGENVTAIDVLLSSFREEGIQVVATTYLDDYKRYLEHHSAFRDVFEVVRVEEVTENEAVEILVHTSVVLEAQFKLVISYKAIRQAVYLAHRYLKNTLLPSSAEELLREAAVLARDRKATSVVEGDVVELVESKIHIPLQKAHGSEVEQLLGLEQEMKRSIVGQEEAVKAVAKSMRSYRSGLTRKDGPIATFLFVGPTGVGKTEVAKAFARSIFQGEQAIIRFDMAEFQEKNALSRLMGSLEQDTQGLLTSVVRDKPFSLILLDEFEKANPDVLNLFLSIFDEGKCTDAWGRATDFSNTIIIATSNAHSKFIYESIEKKVRVEDMNEELKHKLLDYFRPELLNRFSGVIIFTPLSKEHLRAIAELHIKKLISEVRSSHGIELQCTAAAFSFIVELGFDPLFGARPLRNVLEETIKPLIAEYLLRAGENHKQYVTIDVRDKQLYLDVANS